ncbi:MAG TPA: GyrI-like domain-containing protein [Paucimonas sp.]|nr:GyrI-like domain-containing protein [Paucimonas sp.]
MEVRIIDLPRVTIACQRHIGPYGPAIGTFWRGTFSPWLAANGLTGRPCYGIGHDDPSATPPDQCRYDAGVEIPDDLDVQAPSMRAVLPGGRYAVAQFKGAAAAIGDAWMQLCREWLPASDWQHDARPWFEYYPEDFSVDAKTGEFYCELCIPVCPR